MNYLYGDSTPAKLTSNVLEFLRDALDFSVFAVQADERIKTGKAKARAAGDEADAEIARLQGYIQAVQKTIAEADKGKAESPTAQCSTRLVELVNGAERAAIDGIKKKLAEHTSALDAAEQATRASVLSALGKLLAPHDPPEATVTLRATLNTATARYETTVEGRAPGSGLAWTFALAIPDSDIFGSPLHVDAILPQLEIRAPQLTGWISKEVKIKPLRLERFIVTELVNENTTTRVKLRPEADADTGFDLHAELRGAKRVSAKRVAPDGDASQGDFEIDLADVKNLLELVEKLRAKASGLARGELSSATFDRKDFSALPSFVPFVERMIAHLAPIVREIAARSTATELVLRRALGEDRREEIFVTKSVLRDKYNVLEAHHRALFAPLGLDSTVRPRQETSSYSDEKAVRAEVAPSGPPPAPEASSAGATPSPRTAPSKPPPPEGAPPPPSSRKLAAVAQPQEAPAPSKREESNPSLVLEKLGRNEPLVLALKKILTLSKAGRVDDAYREWSELFGSDAFSGYPVEEQRKALKLMVSGKPPGTKSDQIAAASRLALERTKKLVDAHGDLGDIEISKTLEKRLAEL